MGGIIGIFSFLFGKSKKNKWDKNSGYSPPVIGSENVNIEDGKIVLSNESNTSEDNKIWNISSTGASIVSPVTRKVVSSEDDKKIIIERRNKKERRNSKDRRIGESDRRKGKKFILRNRRKNEWRRRSDYDRRFNDKRRHKEEKYIQIIDNSKDIAKGSEIRNKNNDEIEYIDASILKDENELTNERIEIIPQRYTEKSKSISILSGRESEVIERSIMPLGDTEIVIERDNIVRNDIDKTEIALTNGTRIGYIYRHGTIEDGEGNNFIEIVDSTLEFVDLYCVGKEIMFKNDDISISFNVDKSSYETINIVANRDVNIYIDKNSTGFIKIGSYRTFEH